MKNVLVSFAFASLLAVTSFAVAGDLNPPAGPVAPTARFGPRIEINQANTPGDSDSLFRISAPGSYYLGGNITGVTSKHGIEIAASGVTIDLMGFEMLGVVGSFVGIRNFGAQDDLTIRNGTVTGWGRDGIDLADSSAGSGSLIESIHTSNNGSFGIRSSSHAVIRACSAVSNNSVGIIGFESSIVESCTASLNGAQGIIVGSGALVRGCLARDNVSIGISVSFGGTVVDCSAFSNDSIGISAGSGSTVHHCTATQNTGDGILVISDSIVLSNTCDSNGSNGDGAGIHSINSDNRIEGNNVTDNDRGIDVDGPGNLIISNSASGNTANYSIVAGNSTGQILNVAGATITTGNPWANFSF